MLGRFVCSNLGYEGVGIPTLWIFVESIVTHYIRPLRNQNGTISHGGTSPSLCLDFILRLYSCRSTGASSILRLYMYRRIDLVDYHAYTKRPAYHP